VNVGRPQPLGNHFDKYATTNPVARRLVARFLADVTALYRSVRARSVLEVGCGEGKLAHHLLRHAPRPDRFVACDLSLERLPADLDPLLERREATIYDLPFPDRSFDLVVCCEVLEHLERPALGLTELARVARRAVLLSTPWEPVWRVLNLARGRYLLDLGNTPGHVQHFSRGELLALAGSALRIVETRRPLPWTVVLGEPRP
jgi:ubiquinone/menaquinone biosynthesis C-methylase UbiE